MKKRVLTFAVVALLAVVAVGCTHHTCPAYRGSSAMMEEAGNAQLV